MVQDTTDHNRPGEWRDALATDVLKHYVGKHIAIVHKHIVASGTSYDDVLKIAEELFPDEMPYIAYIPEKNT